jgi:DNA-binding NarL/FixJ family response regulator
MRRPKFSTWGVARKFGYGKHEPRPPKDHLYADEMRCIGWRWVCPGCKKEVRKIYYPLPVRTLFDFLGYDPGRSDKAVCQSKKFLPYDADELVGPPPTFACAACHRVEWFTRTNARAWNQVVSHLSRGMLYGREVAKPEWYRRERKKARCRKLGQPALKREGVLRRMSNGWTIEQIAKDMLISTASVRWMMRFIFKQEGVKNRRGLGAKLGWKHEQPLNEREKLLALAAVREELVLRMVLQGMSFKEIARRTGMKVGTAEHVASRVYRKHGVEAREGRKGLVKKVGVEVQTAD